CFGTTPLRCLSSSTKSTCVRLVDTLHGDWFSDAPKCRSLICRPRLHQSTSFGRSALQPPKPGGTRSRRCAADRSNSKREQQQRRLLAGRRLSRTSAPNRRLLRNKQQSRAV